MGARVPGTVSAQRTNDRMRAVCGWFQAVAAVIVAGVLGGIMLSPSSTDAASVRVVDGATGEPLEGAVVVVVWNRAVFHGVTSYHVVERVTGADGTCSATVFPWVSFPAERRDLVVFKPGYRPRIEHTRDTTTPLFRQAEFALMKVASLEEARRYHDASDVGVAMCIGEPALRCVRPEQVPRLMRLMGIQQRVFNPPAGIIPSRQGGR